MTRLLLALFLLTAPAAAQTFPEPLSGAVSDFASVLDPEAEARIAGLLRAARADPGTEIAVVTIGSHRDHGPHPSLERFATGLFNAWGIGDAARDDGILILVAATDRTMRIELGAGHPQTWDFVAEEIVHRVMLPAFRTGDLARGIEAGTRAAVERIARPFAAGDVPPPRSLADRLRDHAPVALFLAALAAILTLAARSAWRRRHPACPSCGSRRTSVAGAGAPILTCAACAYRGEYRDGSPGTDTRRAKAGGGDGSGFGGGSSSGGGASGRW